MDNLLVKHPARELAQVNGMPTRTEELDYLRATLDEVRADVKKISENVTATGEKMTSVERELGHGEGKGTLRDRLLILEIDVLKLTTASQREETNRAVTANEQRQLRWKVWTSLGLALVSFVGSLILHYLK